MHTFFFSKIFQHICVSVNINFNVSLTNDVVSFEQLGRAFRKNRSCESQLITVINDWANLLDSGGQVDTFILDFEKAFDTSPRDLLKCKLLRFGICGKKNNFNMD